MEFYKSLSLFHLFNAFGFCFYHIFTSDLLVATEGSEVLALQMKQRFTCTFGEDIESVALNLEEELSRILNWFRNNHMADYPAKCLVMFSWLNEKLKSVVGLTTIGFATSLSFSHKNGV